LSGAVVAAFFLEAAVEDEDLAVPAVGRFPDLWSSIIITALLNTDATMAPVESLAVNRMLNGIEGCTRNTSQHSALKSCNALLCALVFVCQVILD
jgi:hypothetical protein